MFLLSPSGEIFLFLHDDLSWFCVVGRSSVALNQDSSELRQSETLGGTQKSWKLSQFGLCRDRSNTRVTADEALIYSCDFSVGLNLNTLFCSESSARSSVGSQALTETRCMQDPDGLHGALLVGFIGGQVMRAEQNLVPVPGSGRRLCWLCVFVEFIEMKFPSQSSSESLAEGRSKSFEDGGALQTLSYFPSFGLCSVPLCTQRPPVWWTGPGLGCFCV